MDERVCPPETDVTVQENNTIGSIVTTFNILDGVTLTVTTNPMDAFEMKGQNLVTTKVLDYEDLPPSGSVLIVIIACEKSSSVETMRVIVIVENVNDNPPVFEKSHFTISVNELTPKGTSVARIEAEDLDSSTLYYHLEPEMDAYFSLESSTNPNILVAKHLDYDIIQRETMVIHVQDSPEGGLDVFSSSATITINIVDIDNRPPWFQPCTEMMVDLAKICINSGYRGTVNLTEQASGPLTLLPSPVYAVDGDTSRNEAIGYSIIGGNEDGIFDISPNNGNVTMLKAADVPGPIILTVLAVQVVNSNQFATTTVVFTVVKRSIHPPKFVKQRYDGYISSDSELGSMVLEKNSQRPLRVQATDEDFASGINPDMVYEIPNSNDFAVTAEGFVLSKKDVTPGTVDFQIRAVDSSNGEADTAAIYVEVLPEGSTVPTGLYHMEDMAALGASLAAVVLLCLVVIGLLAFRIRKGKADWQKLTEATIFRSAFARGSTGPKEGLEYTNDGFQNDGDTGSLSKVPQEIDLRLDTMTGAKAKEASSPEKTTPVTSQSQFNTFLHDTGSLAGSEKADSEKEVKPILTKERRNEDGYKSVWFKEDIDPGAKEEVVIIPDNGEQEDDDDDDDSFEGEHSPVTVPKVMFADGQKDEKKADKNRASALEEEDGMDL
ncbi:cadherin-related family member 5 isoform X2 [Scleropages formosus]|uniref:Cadherin-related family member 5b n=1 Tax=Scleropages formosus TaxID=113540 RepID=A0A8C9QNJ8_SCLFO|nr:cadherin-related family member 5-like isoform X2 [Scleropages formosus]